MDNEHAAQPDLRFVLVLADAIHSWPFEQRHHNFIPEPYETSIRDAFAACFAPMHADDAANDPRDLPPETSLVLM